MSEPYLCELKIIAFNYPPKGWAFCNGQLLPINQNQALFSLLGTMYGGDGRVNFALPNLQGKVPIHIGAGYTQGQTGGEQNHTLIQSEMPAHIHIAHASTAVTTNGTPAGNYPAAAASHPFSSGSVNTTLVPTAVTSAGGTQPHNNMPPYLVLNICIALQGIFPSRN